ncbi:MAG: hypothetical protein O3A00_13000 [Planctomycetota bacterium]|nr:hypothetical protein [Planctomycetota bacterium]
MTILSPTASGRRIAWAVLAASLLAPSLARADGLFGLFNWMDRKAESSVESVRDYHCRGGVNCRPVNSYMTRDGVVVYYTEPKWRIAGADSGWNAPQRTPVQRVPVTYRNYWPQNWYGQPSNHTPPSHPTIYTPTDTTQLGYYYTRVPSWQPNRAMRPPAPWPAFYHDRACPQYGGYCPHAVVIQSGPAPAAQPQTLQIPPQPEPADGATTASINSPR